MPPIEIGVVFVVTGVPLWLQSGIDSELLQVMRLFNYVAALAGGLLLLLHTYLGTVAFPGTVRGMLHGKVSREWAKLHHSLRYREQSGD